MKTHKYPPVFWSCYDRIINFIPRSTNAVEERHRAINNFTTVSYPNLAIFIIILKNLAEKNKNFIITSVILKFIFISDQNFLREAKLKAVLKNKKKSIIGINTILHWR
ncbi:hypothetical protein DMUE_5116 [Dictyocoela muelleri]|nr:hypothetical protein DMUE_5116 [Dictyocoela muelleri]